MGWYDEAWWKIFESTIYKKDASQIKRKRFGKILDEDIDIDIDIENE